VASLAVDAATVGLLVLAVALLVADERTAKALGELAEGMPAPD
jgi:hypothetical protein